MHIVQQDVNTDHSGIEVLALSLYYLQDQIHRVKLSLKIYLNCSAPNFIHFFIEIGSAQGYGAGWLVTVNEPFNVFNGVAMLLNHYRPVRAKIALQVVSTQSFYGTVPSSMQPTMCY